jgi:hypothetical protein
MEVDAAAARKPFQVEDVKSDSESDFNDFGKSFSLL